MDTTDGTTANTVSAGTITSGIMSPGTIAATQTPWFGVLIRCFLYTKLDAVPTSAPTVGAVGNFGTMTSNTSGVAGDLAGTISTAGAMTITAGGAGTSAIGQFSSELIIK